MQKWISRLAWNAHRPRISKHFIGSIRGSGACGGRSQPRISASCTVPKQDRYLAAPDRRPSPGTMMAGPVVASESIMIESSRERLPSTPISLILTFVQDGNSSHWFRPHWRPNNTRNTVEMGRPAGLTYYRCSRSGGYVLGVGTSQSLDTIGPPRRSWMPNL